MSRKVIKEYGISSKKIEKTIFFCFMVIPRAVNNFLYASNETTLYILFSGITLKQRWKGK